MSPSLSGWFERHRVATYVVLTYGISWSLFGLWSVTPESTPVFKTLLFVGGGFGPMAAAVVLLAARGQSLGDWFRSVFRFRVRPRYYLVALAFPIAALVVASRVHAFVLGGATTVDRLPALYEYPIFLVFIFFLGGGQEEPGWRGYLLPLLQSRYNALIAALIIGVVWAVWHLPLFVFSGTVQSDMPFWLYVPQVTGTSIVLTWLTNVSRGSVLPAMVLHAGANAVINYYAVGGVTGATTKTGYGLLTAFVVLVAVVLVVRYGPTLRPGGREDGVNVIDPVVPSD
ncbi:CPBP family intramembrane glutamic endopeptidase [Haladaptatus sp. NG-WS-4]